VPEDYLHSEYDIARCCYKLLDTKLFQENSDYVRRQFLYCLLQVGGYAFGIGCRN